MLNLSRCVRHPAVLSSTVFLNLLATPLAALAQAPPAATGGNSHAAHAAKKDKACQPADVEAKKHQQEKQQLGNRHANEHAHMRAVQCEVERGVRAVPAKDKVKDAQQTLKEDDDFKQAFIKGNAGRTSESTQASPLLAAGATAALAAAVTDPAVVGRWSDPFVVPVVGIAAVLLHTGKVMFWSYDPVDYHNPANSKNGVGYIWDPKTRTGYNIPPPENIWCAAQTILSDGRVYVAGGNLRYPDPNAPPATGNWQGTLTNYTFNPITELWARQPDMRRGRWYPTVTQLADNRVVITSGVDETGSYAINNDVEIFTPSANIAGIGTMSVVGTHNTTGLYPLQFLLPSGQVLEAGPDAGSSFQFNAATSNWSSLPRMTSNHYNLPNGISFTDASVAPAKQLIMVAGGHDGTVPLAKNEWLDGFNPLAGWKPYPQWLTPRYNANTIILPDTKMLTVGGNKGLYGYEDAEFSVELYSQPINNTTGVWTTMAPHIIQAAYHSSAILLPDATVLLSQDDMNYEAQWAFQHKVQVYSPPYLFKGVQPKITAAPASVGYGQSFTVSTDRNTMVSAILVAPGATTHANDMHQRAIKLKVQQVTNGLIATVPTSSAVVPPGHYMLFVVDSLGIPSVAKFVRVS